GDLARRGRGGTPLAGGALGAVCRREDAASVPKSLLTERGSGYSVLRLAPRWPMAVVKRNGRRRQIWLHPRQPVLEHPLGAGQATSISYSSVGVRRLIATHKRRSSAGSCRSHAASRAATIALRSRSTTCF